MALSRESTLVVLYGDVPDDAALSALQASAEALGHKDGCCFATVAELMETGAGAGSGQDDPDAAELMELGIRELDPWSVVAVDDIAIGALAQAFGARSAALEPDAPVHVDGYTLVAVPDFSACLDDRCAKRVAWGRLKAAAHPGNPLD